MEAALEAVPSDINDVDWMDPVRMVTLTATSVFVVDRQAVAAPLWPLVCPLMPVNPFVSQPMLFFTLVSAYFLRAVQFILLFHVPKITILLLPVVACFA